MTAATVLLLLAGAAPPPTPVTTTIRLHKGPWSGFLYAHVRVNGKPATFALDTGSCEDILTPEAADRLGIPCVRTGMLVPAAIGQDRPLYRAESARLDLGTGAARTTLFTISNINWGKGVSEITQEGIKSFDGLIGYPTLSHYQSNIDYPAASLRVRDSLHSEADLPGSWQSETVKSAGEDSARRDRRGRLTLSVNSLHWQHPSGVGEGSWLLDRAGDTRVMNWQVRDSKIGGFTLSVLYHLDGDHLTVAGRLLADISTTDMRPADLSPAATKPFNVVTFRRVRAVAPIPRPKS